MSRAGHHASDCFDDVRERLAVQRSWEWAERILPSIRAINDADDSIEVAQDALVAIRSSVVEAVVGIDRSADAGLGSHSRIVHQEQNDLAVRDVCSGLLWLTQTCDEHRVRDLHLRSALQQFVDRHDPKGHATQAWVPCATGERLQLSILGAYDPAANDQVGIGRDIGKRFIAELRRGEVGVALPEVVRALDLAE